MSKKLTPWFPASVTPVHRGWYLARSTDEDYLFVEQAKGLPVKRFWNGRYWEWKAQDGVMRSAAFSKHDQWRGLAEKP